jgi:hypothetical protein
MFKRILKSIIIPIVTFLIGYLYFYKLPFFLALDLFKNNFLAAYICVIFVIPFALLVGFIIFILIIYFPFLNWIYWLRLGKRYITKENKSGWQDITPPIAFGVINKNNLKNEEGKLSNSEEII